MWQATCRTRQLPWHTRQLPGQQHGVWSGNTRSAESMGDAGNIVGLLIAVR